MGGVVAADGDGHFHSDHAVLGQMVRAEMGQLGYVTPAASHIMLTSSLQSVSDVRVDEGFLWIIMTPLMHHTIMPDY